MVAVTSVSLWPATLAKTWQGLSKFLTNLAPEYLAQIDPSCAERTDLLETVGSNLHGPEMEELMAYTNLHSSSTSTFSLQQIHGQDVDAVELPQFFGYLSHNGLWYKPIQARSAMDPA